MTGYWIGFVLVLVLTILGSFKIKMSWCLRIRYWFFVGIIDAFYISVAYQNLTWQFIFGCLMLAILFVNLGSNFVHSNKQLLIKRIEMVFDFMIGIGVSIYLIFIIPNDDLKNVIIPIVAAIYGGLITLAGVAWTIKNSENNIRLDNKMKNKPILIMKKGDPDDIPPVAYPLSADIRESEKSENLAFIMKNISKMPCKICGIDYSGDRIKCTNEHLWVESQQEVTIYFQKNDFDYGYGKIILLLEDISGNSYSYLLEYDKNCKIVSVKEKENK